MSKFNQNDIFWKNYRINQITILKKLGEKEYKQHSKNRYYSYKTDILLARCDCGYEYEISAKAIINDKPISCRRCKGCIGKTDICNVGTIVNTLICTKLYSKKSKSGRSELWVKAICQKCNTEKHLRCQTFKVNNCDCKCIRRVHSRIIGRHTTPDKYFRILKYGAERRGIKVDIKLEDMINLFNNQNHKCILSGEDISFEDGSFSLDRIDSSKGYTIGNIQCVHRDVNFMKNSYSQDRFIEICSKVTILNRKI